MRKLTLLIMAAAVVLATLGAAQDQDAKWHEIEATMAGAKGVVEFDGKKVLEFEDPTFKDAGKVGLWTKSDASSSFDDFSIEWHRAK
jgi:hypothetical protein